jgi:DNA polymerase-3 subunit beta
MKISLTQENLHKALGVVGRIVSNRSSLPVLSHVLLSADANRLRLAATNLEIGINYWIGCKVTQEGAVTVPARLLSEFVSNLPPGNIDLTASESNLTITTPHYESQINGIAADEFPLIPEVKNQPALVLPAADLADAIAQVVVAASVDENRPVLAGVHWYIEGKKLVLVATDSYRLAEKKLPLKGAVDEKLSIIIPTQTMQELVRVLADRQGDIKVYYADNQVMFQADDMELTSRLIEGQFPNYRQIIPSETGTLAVVNTSEFTRITKVASLFARENASSVRLAVQAEGQISIASSAAQVGENTSTADCEVEGDDGEISLNGRYLIDALGVVKSDDVAFSVSGKLNPCALQPSDDEDYLHIIMPLRT